MNRPEFEVADVIKQFGNRFIAECHPNRYQVRVLGALSICRTASLGGHKEVCDCCGKSRISYNSCRNRHCPRCQASKQAFWVEDLLESVLPVKHYHIVFTVPHTLNTICQQNSRWFYNQLFSAVWETLQQFGYTRFGVESGAVCMLHTWGQNLSLHPHIHCIVPAAGETLSGNMKHIGGDGKFLYPVKQLSLVFRGKLMGRMKKHPGNKMSVDKYRTLFETAWQNPWSVFCEPSLGKPEHVVKYLGQYTHRVAIANHRILNINDQNVTFLHKDYADGAKQKPILLSGVEFLRRFCLHILPHRFVKIRRYGIYSSRYRAMHKKQNPKMTVDLKPKETTQQRIQRLTGFDVFRCPFCKRGIMHRVEELPRVRSPPTFYRKVSDEKK
jgi:Putative transposase/Transposase zinc-binding domain